MLALSSRLQSAPCATRRIPRKGIPTRPRDTTRTCMEPPIALPAMRVGTLLDSAGSSAAPLGSRKYRAGRPAGVAASGALLWTWRIARRSAHVHHSKDHITSPNHDFFLLLRPLPSTILQV